MKTNIDLTNYLKGFAILTVISGHFSLRFMPEEIMSFGNYFISLFFILSGYGLYFSLEKHMDSRKKTLWSFYLKRFVRIYPLYWINFFLNFATDPTATLSVSTLWEFFLLDFSNPARLWFLNALIPCYIFAPLIFRIIRQTKIYFPLYLIVLFVLINYLFAYLGVPKVRCWVYRGIYLNQMLLFAAGMWFPVLRKKDHTVFGPLWVVLSFLLMFYSFIQTSNFSFEFMSYPTFNQILFSVSTLLFVYIFIFGDVAIPLLGIIKKIGAYSYSLFLFEGAYATILNRLKIIDNRANINLLWFVIFFPIFIFLAASLEEIVNSKMDLKKAYSNFRAQFFPNHAPN
ncbi:acyltransferase [uncultured Desulfobacter sp.]|uniref:acyltransferase family protein n=1 Tax=uncultured Desulfobacter sp. TaxID=240139 RepID=UPI0029F4B6F3|nr:acyltransferase [uncultured Desulfobacter sp.]